MLSVAPWLREFNQILHNQQHGTVNAFIPPADVLIDDDGVTVYMDVPGLRSENLEIELENDVLTVRGERAFPYAREDGSGPVRRIERGFGRFERTLHLPEGTDTAAASASYKDGLLEITLPKRQPRQVPISRQDAASSGTEAP